MYQRLKAMAAQAAAVAGTKTHFEEKTLRAGVVESCLPADFTLDLTVLAARELSPSAALASADRAMGGR